MIMQDQKHAVQRRKQRAEDSKGIYWTLSALALFFAAHVAVGWLGGLV